MQAPVPFAGLSLAGRVWGLVVFGARVYSINAFSA